MDAFLVLGSRPSKPLRHCPVALHSNKHDNSVLTVPMLQPLLPVAYSCLRQTHAYVGLTVCLQQKNFSVSYYSVAVHTGTHSRVRCWGQAPRQHQLASLLPVRAGYTLARLRARCRAVSTLGRLYCSKLAYREKRCARWSLILWILPKWIKLKGMLYPYQFWAIPILNVNLCMIQHLFP